MSEASKSLPASTDHGQVGPDCFGFYTREIIELLSQDEDSVPANSRTSELTRKKCGGVRSKDTIDASWGTISSFSNSLGAGFSDLKKERLKSLLRQGVFDLTPEVDEMLDPVISMCQLLSQIRNKNCSSSLIDPAPEGDAEQVPLKKLKISSCSSSASPLKHGSCREGAVTNDIHVSEKEISNIKKNCAHCLCQKTSQWITSPEGPKVDGDLQFLLESDCSEVEETVKKFSDELSATLGHMEQQLEVLLIAVVSRCRPMTRAEKQELRKLIQKLPQNNLDRVVEIVQHSKLADSRRSEEFFVDLEKEGNVTLWRLYYYVKAVEKARELL